MKTYRYSRGIAPPFLTLALDGSSQLHALAALAPQPPGKTPVDIEQGSGCAPEPAWTLRKGKKKNLLPC
jgi:hypothetical protein